MNSRLAIRVSFVLAALGTALAASAQNLVANGGFETGTFSNWTTMGNGLTGPNVDTAHAHSGTYGAYLDSRGDGVVLSQNVATVPGQTYRIGFWANGAFGTFTASFGGTTLGSNAATSGYAFYSYLATATSASTPLVFTVGPFSAPALDDVSVQATPEPATLAALGLGVVALIRRRRG